MHPFFSNQISQIRSVPVISYPFVTWVSPAVPNIINTIVVLWEFCSAQCVWLASILPLPLILVCHLPQRSALQRRQKRPFSVLLFTLHSVRHRVCVCVCVFVFPFPLFSHSFLPESCSHGEERIHNWTTVFLRGPTPRGKLNLLKMLHSERRLRCDVNVAWKVRPWIEQISASLTGERMGL